MLLFFIDKVVYFHSNFCYLLVISSKIISKFLTFLLLAYRILLNSCTLHIYQFYLSFIPISLIGLSLYPSLLESNSLHFSLAGTWSSDYTLRFRVPSIFYAKFSSNIFSRRTTFPSICSSPCPNYWRAASRQHLAASIVLLLFNPTLFLCLRWRFSVSWVYVWGYNYSETTLFVLISLNF
jgi:hypothetical protein